MPSGNEEVKSKGVRKGEAERRGGGETGETPLANGRLQLSLLTGTDPPRKVLDELRDMISLLMALQNATQN